MKTCIIRVYEYRLLIIKLSTTICSGLVRKKMKKNILITGGSRGIGAACVRKFAAEGYKVYFNYLKSEEEAKRLSDETGSCAIKCDVASGADVERMLDITGGVDILVNNAGISHTALFTDIKEEEWDRVFDVNIKGMFLVTKAFLPYMIRNKYGKIVNISSMWGVSGGSCEVSYSASKAAVIGFTKALAKEEGPSGINVNCIAPGLIETEMNANLSEEDKKAIAEETPLMRTGNVEEIAESVFFLCSDKAAFITGQVLCVDGGIII